MASKRTLKKSLKDIIYDIMDECDYIIVTGGKNWEKAEKLMDETVEFYEEAIQRISASKSKADFAKLNGELQGKIQEFRDKVNAIQ